MVTRAILEAHGVTHKAWRARLEKTPLPSQTDDARKPIGEASKDEQLQRLFNRIHSRVRQGREYNLLNYRTVQALNLVWDAAFRQTTPTLLANALRNYRPGSGPDAEKDMESALHSCGLKIDEIIYDTGQVDLKTGQPVKEISAPSFFNIIVPLVRSMLEARRAKLVNDRNVRPFHKFESPVSDPVQRLKCEVITARVEAVKQQYGYLETLKQAVFQMLLYGTCLQFTREAWHSEEQLKLAGKEDLGRTLVPAQPFAEGDEIPFTSREGLRYFHGDPARTFWDQAYPAWTFNTDTGCGYAGTWRVMRFGEILDNATWYNKDQVSFGRSAGAWWDTNVNFFNAVYNSAVMAWPQVVSAPEGATDREKWLLDHSLYSQSMAELSVVVTEYWERIIPADYGLGDYKYPVWARFVLAGDDSTIIYAEPLCYQGVVAYRYNGDDRKTEDAAMGLLLLPHQDMVSNLVSQFLYTAKQNLTNITLIDKNALEDGMWDRIKNLGERLVRGLNVFLFDSKRHNRMQINLPQAFYSHRFPVQDTNGILQSIKLIMDLADRLVQFSAQEVAQAASHEQTKREMDLISASTSNVLQFTGTPVDAALGAQARQLYEALMNYGDDDFYAQIPFDPRIDRKNLEALGITYVFAPGDQDRRALVRVRKSALDQVFFSIVPAWNERNTNIDQGRALAEMVRDWFVNNPIGQSALGPEQLVELFNYVALKQFNLPLEHPLRNAGLSTPDQNAQAQQQLEAIAQNLLRQSKEGMVPVLEELQSLGKAVAWIYRQTNIPPPPAGEGQPNDANSMPMPAVAGGPGPAPAPLAGPAGM